MTQAVRITEEPTEAIIYCRVSSTKQVAEGSGLESQEHRCRQYADAKGYEVAVVFPADVSGGGRLHEAARHGGVAQLPGCAAA
ncbi:MAG: recombinase family protein [Pseudomonadota bacterium]